jgi:hypothetical protein
VTIPGWFFDEVVAGNAGSLPELRARLEAWARLLAGADEVCVAPTGAAPATRAPVTRPAERDVKATEAAHLLGLHPSKLDAMRRRGQIVPSTDAGAGARWYSMAELRRLKPDVSSPPAVELLTKREGDFAARYHRTWPWLAGGGS